MELSFATEQLRALCESRRRAVKSLGVEAAQALEMVLADIEACQSVSELAAIYGDLPFIAGAEGWELKLEGGIALRLASGHVQTPKRKNGAINQSKVTRIKIEDIGAV